MIIYNVTIKIETAIASEWLRWLQDVHIPEMINTGCFTDAKLLKLLDTDESDGPTYAVHYYTNNKDLYNKYIEKFSGPMRQKSFEQWGNKFIAFRTIMEVVN